MKITLLLFSLLQGLALFASTKPNVIFILVDDMGYGDLGCYGQDILKTPHIDQLAREGMRFTRCYSGSTVCAPSRCVLMTGKHTGYATIRGNGDGELKPDEETLGKLFKKAGYATGNFGKWGIGRPKELDNPNRHGFDDFYGYIDATHAHNFYPEFIIHNGQRVALRNELMDVFKNTPKSLVGAGVAKEKIDYAPDFIRTQMMSFLEQHHQKPFFLLYTPNTPHANNEGGKHHRGMEVPSLGGFENKDWPLEEKGFAKMIDNLDQDVKNIKAFLKSKGILDNTIIMFSSDNGPHQEGGHQVDFFDSNGEKRGFKRDLYEGGVRVPFIASWPATIPAGKINHSMVSFQDILPTFAEILGQSTTESTGTSILKQLEGKEMAAIDRSLYWEFPEGGGKQAILKGNKKLIRLLNMKGHKFNEVYELYDVVKDPTEANNIIAQYPELAESLKKEMLSMPDENTLFPAKL